MGLLGGLFKKKGSLSGRVKLENLPEPRMGTAVSIALLQARSADAKPPWIVPPGSAIKDEVMLKTPQQPESHPLTFRLERPAGFYHVMVGVIVLRREGPGKAQADIKNYIVPQPPVEIRAEENTRVELVHDWNFISDAALKSRGTVGGR